MGTRKKQTTTSLNKSNNTEFNKDKLNYDQLIALLSVYEAEFEHRDNVLYSRLFTLSYISLFIMLLPYLTSISSFSLPRETVIAIGIINEIITFIISKIHANRLDCISTTYRNLLKILPKGYSKLTIEEALVSSDSKLLTYISKKNPKMHKKIIDTAFSFYAIKLTYFSPNILCFCIIIIGCILLFLC